MTRVVEGFRSFSCTPARSSTIIYEGNEQNLPLLSQPKQVRIYRHQRDGRLSRPRYYGSEPEVPLDASQLSVAQTARHTWPLDAHS